MSEFKERKTEAGDMVIDGVVFEAWHVGVSQYERRSTDGRARVWRNPHRANYSAVVDGVNLGSGFHDYKRAMAAAVKAMKTESK